MNAAHVTIVNSDIRGIKAAGQDSQAIAGWNTPGPITIRNNFLEAAGENIMFGGANAAIPNVVPSDISAFNMSGHDDTAISGQLARILIKDNLVYDISSANCGGSGIFVQMGGEPRDITIDHNTVMHTGNIMSLYSGVYYNSSGVRVTGGPIQGLVFTNNMMKHNAYGIFGSGRSYGNDSLNYYAPGAVVRRNVMAKDSSPASRYPPDNFFPTVAAFMANFVNPAAGDYRLIASSPYIGAGTDGRDLGCRLSGGGC